MGRGGNYLPRQTRIEKSAGRRCLRTRRCCSLCSPRTATRKICRRAMSQKTIPMMTRAASCAIPARSRLTALTRAQYRCRPPSLRLATTARRAAARCNLAQATGTTADKRAAGAARMRLPRVSQDVARLSHRRRLQPSRPPISGGANTTSGDCCRRRPRRRRRLRRPAAAEALLTGDADAASYANDSAR